jgi:hypothetical protein
MQPLVSDLNALLAARDAIVARAQAKAGDSGARAQDAARRSAHEAASRRTVRTRRRFAAAIRLESARMQRQIDYHRAHARASPRGRRQALRALLKRPSRLVAHERLHADRGIRIDCDVNPAHAVRCARSGSGRDAGNSAGQRGKWARTRVDVRSACHAGSDDRHD